MDIQELIYSRSLRCSQYIFLFLYACPRYLKLIEQFNHLWKSTVLLRLTTMVLISFLKEDIFMPLYV